VGSAEPPTTTEPSTATTVATPDPDQRYRVSVMVLETPTQPPTACLGAILASDPPAGCDGIALERWDWAAVADVTEARGHRYAMAEITGTTDGVTFRLTEPPAPPDSSKGPARASWRPPVPCDEPAGGWTVVDPARTSSADLEAAVAAIQALPDLVDHWTVEPAAADATSAVGTTATSARPDGTHEVGDRLLVVQFSGDMERHRQVIEALWGGPLCVAQRQPYRWTGSEAFAVLTSAEARAAGVWALRSTSGSRYGDERPGRIFADLLVLDHRVERWVDEHLGAGEVTLGGLLTPVP
jgi:hypothetical protein